MDSKYVITHLTKSRQKFEDDGYIGTPNADLIQATVARARARPGITKLKWVKGHNGHSRNEGADQCANEGACKADPDFIDIDVPPELKLTGARLSKMKQSTAYRAIREITAQGYTKRTRTKQNIEKAQDQAEETFGIRPTECALWMSMNHKDFPKEIRYFLWMTAHDAYMIGSNWKRPGYKDEFQKRGDCQHRDCNGALESMEHILTQCNYNGQAEIWKLTKNLWERKFPGKDWRMPTLGTVLSCGVAYFTNEKGKRKSGHERLYRIMIAEAAYLIWKMRCDRVINKDNAEPTTEEVINRWNKMMNERLALDCSITQQKYGKKGLPKPVVLRTWQGTLKDENQLPDDWTGVPGVLVGNAAAGRRRRRVGEG
jgi:ribonuclease HI